ncbi:MAG: cytochrome P450 [Myxococcota bacterium]
MARDPLAFFTRLFEEQGAVASFDFALGRQWLISDPKAIETVFGENHDNLAKDAATLTLKPLFGQGLLTTDGETWKRMRRLNGSLFKAKHIRHFADQMVQAAADEPLETGTVDVHPATNRITRRVILEAMFGTAEDEASAIADAIEAYIHAQEREFLSLRRFYPSFLSTPARRQAVRSRRVLAECLAPMIEARRGLPEDEQMDMLARLVAARDAEGRGLSFRELQDNVATLYLGATETAANTLSFAIGLLARRPEIQDRLAEERAAVLDGRRPSVGDVKALKRHAAVLDEAMRLYPPFWALGRKVLRSFEVGGRRIEAGDQLNASPWVVHRDARWFDRPLEFRPERFWTDDPRPRPRLAFFPFGAGPRTCIGSHFARMEMVLVLATWLARRRVAPVAGRPLRHGVRLTLQPSHGAWVEVSA